MINLQDVLSILVNTLIAVGYLSLATFGIVLIFKTSSTTNFAQGMLGVLGAFTTSYILDAQGVSDLTGVGTTRIISPIEMIIAVLAGMLVSFIVGYLIDAVIFRNSKYTNAATKQIISMGLVLVITGLIPIVFGTVTRQSFLFANGTVSLLGVPITTHNLISLGISGSVILGIFLLLRFTKWGLSVRSVASNEKVASLMGINTNRINAMSWGIAGALGSLAAVMYTASIGSLSVGSMVNVQIDAFYSSVLGGFDTFFGPLGGLLIMDTVRNILPRFLLNLNMTQWSNLILYVLIMLTVLVKPVGIFGKKKVKKV